MKKIAELNRIEVIDWTTLSAEGRAYTKWKKENFSVSLDFQDNKRTLKIFLKDLPPKVKRGKTLVKSLEE